MKFPISVMDGKQAASFRIVGLMLTIAPLWLILASANTPATAQTSKDVSNATPNTTAASSPGDWTQFLANNMQRSNPSETVLGVNNVANLQLKRTQTNSLPFAGFGNPVVANGVAYFGGGEGDNTLYAFDASTGQPLWKYTLADGGEGVISSPAVANGVVYFATFVDTVMYALNAKTGAKLWSFRANSTLTDITVVDGVVYVGGGDILDGGGLLYALDAGTGAVLWSHPGAIGSTPAVANGIVYFDVFGGFRGVFRATTNDVLAVNAHTGKVLWDYFISGSTGMPPTSSTVVANGVVYFSAAVGASLTYNVHAVNANTGKTLWVYKVPDNGLSGTPAVANGVLYIGAIRSVSPGGTVYALNATTGQQLWSNRVSDTEGLSTPAVANGVVYISGGVSFPTTSGHMYALNASTGAMLWSYSLPDSAPNSPIVSNGTVYVTDTHLDKPGQNINHFRAFSIGADLFLRATPSATTVHNGDLLTYTLPVWNLGPANADHEVLMTQVPAGTTFDYVRVSGTPGLGTCTTPPYGGTGAVVCHQNGSMAPNATWTVRLTVKVTAPSGTVITESAATMANTPDPNLANNTAAVSIKVQ